MKNRFFLILFLSSLLIFSASNQMRADAEAVEGSSSQAEGKEGTLKAFNQDDEAEDAVDKDSSSTKNNATATKNNISDSSSASKSGSSNTISTKNNSVKNAFPFESTVKEKGDEGDSGDGRNKKDIRREESSNSGNWFSRLFSKIGSFLSQLISGNSINNAFGGNAVSNNQNNISVAYDLIQQNVGTANAQAIYNQAMMEGGTELDIAKRMLTMYMNMIGQSGSPYAQARISQAQNLITRINPTGGAVNPGVYVGDAANVSAMQVSFSGQPRAWTGYVVHMSEGENDNVASMDAYHKSKGWSGIGYDFVIGNGKSMGDGEIQSTFRWTRQIAGAHAGDTYSNQRRVGICLVGDLNAHGPTAAQQASLVGLLQKLVADGLLQVESPRYTYAHLEVKSGGTDCCGDQYYPTNMFQGLPGR